MELSVVIPVFNGEHTLKRLFKSLNEQTANSFEVIVINDGSTDNSALLLQEFASNSKFEIRVFNQESLGQEAARNRGIRAAKGRYVTFIDSDDWIAPNHLEVMMDLTHAFGENFGIGVVGFYSDIVGGRSSCKRFESQNRVLSGTDFIRKLVSGEIEGFLWNKIFSKKLLLTHLHEDSFNYKEDTRLLLRLAPEVQRCVVAREITYHYVISEQSAVLRHTDLAMWNGWFETFTELMKCAERTNDPEIIGLAARRSWRSILDLISRWDAQDQKNGVTEEINVNVQKELNDIRDQLFPQVNLLDKLLLSRLIKQRTVNQLIKLRQVLIKMKNK